MRIRSGCFEQSVQGNWVCLWTLNWKSLSGSCPVDPTCPSCATFDEVLKLFHSGHGVETFWLLREFGLFATFPGGKIVLMEKDLDPDTGIVLKGLKNTDLRISQRKPVIAAFLFACLFWRRSGWSIATKPNERTIPRFCKDGIWFLAGRLSGHDSRG